MMKSVAILGSMLLGLGLTQAQAADLPAPEVPMIAAAPVAAAYDWTGFYIGLNVGGAWGKIDVRGFGNQNIDGIVGGAQAGANYQWNQFVAGLEADIQGTGFDDSNSRRFNPEGGIFGTVRGRVGFALDRFLVYGTGGFAYSDLSVQESDDFKFGWTAGGGVEWAAWDNWSVKVEYLYADLGDDSVRLRGGDRIRYDYTQNLVRAGINYKF